MIQLNSQKIYLCPSFYSEHFVFEGRRYYLTSSHALVSDYGKYGMMPPAGRGFYLLISKKEFKEIKEKYELQKNKFMTASQSYFNNGGQQPELF